MIPFPSNPPSPPGPPHFVPIPFPIPDPPHSSLSRLRSFKTHSHPIPRCFPNGNRALGGEIPPPAIPGLSVLPGARSAPSALRRSSSFAPSSPREFVVAVALENRGGLESPRLRRDPGVPVGATAKLRVRPVSAPSRGLFPLRPRFPLTPSAPGTNLWWDNPGMGQLGCREALG